MAGGLSGPGTVTGAVITTGTWAPTDASGAGLVFTSINAGWTKIGNMVFAYAEFSYPATADASNATLGSFPFASSATSYNFPSLVGGSVGNVRIEKGVGNTFASFEAQSTGNNIPNSTLSNQTVRIMVIYSTV